MKQFNNLLDAINFQTHCPLCQGELQSNCYVNSKQKIALEFLGNSYYIDVATENIELIVDSDVLLLKSINSYGLLGFSMSIECSDCHMYSFMIQIWVNFKNLSITKIILNSERVSWEDEVDVLHEIISGHSTNNTKYSYYGSNDSIDDGQIILPFIPIDVSNPKDAVARIKKLIVFS
jgi:hypothetical protein